jgi:ribonuclease HI
MAAVSEPRNPGGTIGYGAAIFRGDECVWQSSGMMPARPSSTNNIAEYLALSHALDWLIENRHTTEPILVAGDSKLVINQCFGTWRIKNGAYVEHANAVRKKLRRFSAISGKWIPRDQNQLADDLSKAHLRDAGVEIADRVSNKPRSAEPAPKSKPGQVIWGSDWEDTPW